jgi:hypothetical protein
MRRVTKGLLVVVAAAALGALMGCNERLDDPLEGEGILSIEKVDPATVKADITLTDPNTGGPTPLQNDDITVTVKNRPRTKSTGTFSDVFIEKSERICTFAGATIGGGTGAGAATVASGGSATITTTAVTVAEKLGTGAAVGDSWKCFVRFSGHDLAGNPVTTDFATFVVNFVDK